jgi:hypothetical protein
VFLLLAFRYGRIEFFIVHDYVLCRAEVASEGGIRTTKNYVSLLNRQNTFFVLICARRHLL